LKNLISALAVAAVLAIVKAISALKIVKRRKTDIGCLVDTNAELSHTLSCNTLGAGAKIFVGTLPAGGGNNITTPRVDGGDIDIRITSVHVEGRALFLGNVTDESLIIIQGTVARDSVPSDSIGIRK